MLVCRTQGMLLFNTITFTLINAAQERMEINVIEKLCYSYTSFLASSDQNCIFISISFKCVFIVMIYLISHDLQQVLCFACMSLFYKNKRDNTHRRRSCSEWRLQLEATGARTWISNVDVYKDGQTYSDRTEPPKE